MGNKSAYKHLNLTQRQEIIEILNCWDEKGQKPNLSAIARKFNVSDRTIRRIRDKKTDLQTQLEKAEEIPCFTKRRRIPIANRLDESLYIWYKQQMAMGELISGRMLKEKALIINDEINENPEFKASEGWLTKFKIRYEIRIQGEKLSVDSDASSEFTEKLLRLMETKNMKLHQIYSADETGILWRLLPLFLAHDENDSAEYKELLKDRATLMICSNADGSHKFPLFVIGNSKNPKSLQNVNIDQLPVTYAGEKNAWMTGELFKQWYTEVFLPGVRQHQADKNESYKVLLILDNAKCHLSKDELDSIDEICSVEFLPPNTTARIQPVAQGISEELKMKYRMSLLRDLLPQENEESLFDVMRKKNIETFCMQIAVAWTEITESSLRQAWRKLIPGDEISMPDTDRKSVDDFLQILCKIPRLENCTSKEIDAGLRWLQTDANDPGWQILDVREILHNIQGFTIEAIFLKGKGQKEGEEMALKQEEISIKQEEIIFACEEFKLKQEEIIFADEEMNLKGEDIEDEVDSGMKSEANEAWKALQTFQYWFERRRECTADHLIMLQSINQLCNDIVSRINLSDTLDINTG